MDGGEIAWTLGASVLGAVLGPVIQLVITKDKPTINIGTNNGVVNANTDNSKIRYSNVINYTVVNPPSSNRGPTDTSSSPKTDDDSNTGFIVFGGLILCFIAAVIYAKFKDEILIGLTVSAAFTAFYLLGSIVYLLIKGIHFDGPLVFQLCSMILVSGSTFVSIYLLADPPAFKAGPNGQDYNQIVAAFDRLGFRVFDEGYTVENVFFLVYQLMGALATLFVAFYLILLALKILAVSRIALTGVTNSWRTRLAGFGGKPAGSALAGIVIATLAILLSSGLIYSWLPQAADIRLPGMETPASQQSTPELTTTPQTP